MKDTTAVAQFAVIRDEKSEFLFSEGVPAYILAWTTTPWTLPSNTALCVGPNIDYVRVLSFNPYTGQPALYVVAQALVNAHFNPKAADVAFEDYKPGDKLVPFKVLDGVMKGSELTGISYEQLIPWFNPGEGAFKVIPGDYVTTEDGTGIVHIAPTFGADDAKVARAAGVPGLQVVDRNGDLQAQVDLRGRFFCVEDLDPEYAAANMAPEYAEWAGRYVKNAYDATLAVTDAYASHRNCLYIISTHIVEVGPALSEKCGNVQFRFLPTQMDGTRLVYPYKLAEGISADRHGMTIIKNEKILDIIRGEVINESEI